MGGKVLGKWIEGSRGNVRITWKTTEGVREGGLDRITINVPETARRNLEGAGGKGVRGIEGWIRGNFKIELGYFEVERVGGQGGEVGGDRVKIEEGGWEKLSEATRG